MIQQPVSAKEQAEELWETMKELYQLKRFSETSIFAGNYDYEPTNPNIGALTDHVNKMMEHDEQLRDEVTKIFVTYDDWLKSL